MDAITRVTYYFPTKSLTSFWILANIITDNQPECAQSDRGLIIALIVIFGILVFFHALTDTYQASNGQSYWVFMLPGYGPTCFSLPTETDKDRVYDFFYLKIRDYLHGFLSVTAFVLIILFTNPIAACVFPSLKENGTARFDPAVVRTVPIVVAVIMAFLMVCLGPPRQMLGFTNVIETAPPFEKNLNLKGGVIVSYNNSFAPSEDGGGLGDRALSYPQDAGPSDPQGAGPSYNFRQQSVSRQRDLDGQIGMQLAMPSARDNSMGYGGSSGSASRPATGARDGGEGHHQQHSGSHQAGGRGSSGEGGGRRVEGAREGRLGSYRQESGGHGGGSFNDRGGNIAGGEAGSFNDRGGLGSRSGSGTYTDGAPRSRASYKEDHVSAGIAGRSRLAQSTDEPFGAPNVRSLYREEFAATGAAAPLNTSAGMVGSAREDYPNVRSNMTANPPQAQDGGGSGTGQNGGHRDGGGGAGGYRGGQREGTRGNGGGGDGDELGERPQRMPQDSVKMGTSRAKDRQQFEDDFS